ncbi:hypothetical protein GIB67_028367 [Kingdonia uniflora]|uniref:Reverse transcriptase zinc-binding domain-containing protein n=1 Tax=Kingdonia uniflora TaxID=39325 RepID=A0A7J7MHT3_9MAGN|nr:hypothetical protein GIB67_028367 [Kingdonia uniflora]
MVPKFCPHCKMVRHNLSECRGVRAQVQREKEIKDKRNQEDARKGTGEHKPEGSSFTKNQKKRIRKKRNKEQLGNGKGIRDTTESDTTELGGKEVGENDDQETIVDHTQALIPVEDLQNEDSGIGSASASKKGVASTSLGTGVKDLYANSSVGAYVSPTSQLIRETSLILLNKDENWADMVEDEERDEACVAKFASKISSSYQHITVLCNGAIISAVHASAFKIMRRGLWKDLINVSKLNLPWLALGDFNIIRLQSERFGGTGPTLSAIKEFNDCLDECELLESLTARMKLTWCNGQFGCARISRRLDRALYNSLWAGKYDGWKVKSLARENSDHSALVGGPNSIPKPKNIPFRFLKCWIEIPGFQDLLKNSWEVAHDGNPLLKLMKKLQRLKTKIKIWRKAATWGLSADISRCSEALESLYYLIEFSNNEKLIKDAADMENELNRLLKTENSIWRQKARSQWLTDGERNSAYFHSIHRIKKTKNSITEVVKEDGSSITDLKEIQSHIVDHYTANSIDFWRDCWGADQPLMKAVTVDLEIWGYCSVNLNSIIDHTGWCTPPLVTDFLADHGIDLRNLDVNSNMIDKRVWRHHPQGTFTVQSAQEAIRSKNPKVWWNKFLNCKALHPKSKSFLWRVCQNVLATEDNLRRRRLSFPSRCSLCQMHSESLQHLLWDYGIVAPLWQWLLDMFMINSFPHNMKESLGLGEKMSMYIKDLWRAAVINLTHLIWLSRNSIIFKEERFNGNKLKVNLLVLLKEVASLSVNSMNNTVTDLQIISKLGVQVRARPAPCIESCRWMLP